MAQSTTSTRSTRERIQAIQLNWNNWAEIESFIRSGKFDVKETKDGKVLRIFRRIGWDPEIALEGDYIVKDFGRFGVRKQESFELEFRLVEGITYCRIEKIEKIEN